MAKNFEKKIEKIPGKTRKPAGFWRDHSEKRFSEQFRQEVPDQWTCVLGTHKETDRHKGQPASGKNNNNNN